MTDDVLRPYQLKDLSTVTPFDHLCGIFHDEDDQTAVLTEFVRIGLTRNEKVCLALGEDTYFLRERLLKELSDMDPESLLDKGQLVFDCVDDFYKNEACADSGGDIAEKIFNSELKQVFLFGLWHGLPPDSPFLVP